MDTVERKQRLRSWKQSKQIHYSEKLISQHACFILARLNRLEAKGKCITFYCGRLSIFILRYCKKVRLVCPHSCHWTLVVILLEEILTTFKRILSSPSVSFPFLRAVLRNQMLMFPIYWWEKKRNMRFCAKPTIWMLLGKYGLGLQYGCSLLFVRGNTNNNKKIKHEVERSTLITGPIR